MLKLIVCIIIFAANCCAHQFLTCSISDSVLSQQSPQTSPNPLLGSPKIRGPKGQMGSRGSPGQKGEPGIPDDRQINLLRNQFNSLSQEVEALKNRSRENQLQKQINYLFQEMEALKNQSGKYQPKHINPFFVEGKTLKNQSIGNQLQMQINYLFQEMEALKNQSRKYQQQEQTNSFFLEAKTLKNQSRGNISIANARNVLYVSSYAHIYRLTPGSQSWQKSREICQSWGGDLAIHGMKSRDDRKKLIKNMSIDQYVWIGANDIASEGNWMWVNGERVDGHRIHWRYSGGRGGRASNCLSMNAFPKSSNIGLSYDEPCGSLYKGLCEKEI